MRLKNVVQRNLGRSGFQLVRTPLEGTLARDVKRVIDDRGIRTILDIGAHVGMFGLMLRGLGFEGQIVSFEPSPKPFTELVSKIDGSWQAVQLALGDSDGVADLHIYQEHEEFTSLRRPSDYGLSNFGLTVIETVQVPVRRLDDVVEEMGVDAGSTFVKIDTQGHEQAVISGGSAFLSSAAALQIEIPMFGLYEGAPIGTVLMLQVQQMGFDLVGMFPVHDHPRPLVPVEFDGLFARGAKVG